MSEAVHQNLVTDSTNRGKHSKKWQLAYATIRCYRSILSAARDSVKRKLNSKYPRSLSYTIIDVASEIGYFSINQAIPSELVKEENAEKLDACGGVEGVAKALRSAKHGITGDCRDIFERKVAFGLNSYQKPPAKSLLHFVFKAFKDPMIIFLLVCAAFTLAFGIKKHGLIGWRDGGSIFLAVFLVIGLSSVSNFWPSRQFNKLSEISENVKVKVFRKGWEEQIPIVQIVVGDVVRLKTGDKVPADGLLLDGTPLRVNKSILTGDTDEMEVNFSRNPFLHSGSVVIDGHARMLVTSVGMNTTWGKMMSTKCQDSQESTPLQAQLHKITTLISKVGLTVASLVFAVWLVRYFSGGMKHGYVSGKTGFHDVICDMVGLVATAIAIASGAVAEGLPFAVAVTFACSLKSITNNRALVTKLSACEAIASATTICTRLNKMTVTKFWLGKEFVEPGVSSSVVPNIIQLLHQGVGLNTTQPPSKASSFFWTPTEKAIINWAIQEMDMNIEELKENCSILVCQPSDSVKTCSGFVMRKNDDYTIHLHRKGTSETILTKCSKYYDTKGIAKDIDDSARNKIKQIIRDMEVDGLRCIAFAHKQIPRDSYEHGVSNHVLDENHLILLALVAVKDPCQSGIKNAVQDFRNGGVDVKMVTRDGSSIARAIARECGILTADQDKEGEIVNGVDFRNFTEEDREQKIDTIRVIADASPFDMLLMVRCLKKKRHFVAVTSNETADAAALKEADVGISIGNQTADIAKESSGIVLLDEHFGSVFNVLKWGRKMFNHIRIFTQFQITASITSLVIDFVTVLSAHQPPSFKIVAVISSGEVPFAALQVLWVKLIMGTLAALALAMGQPSKELMKGPVDQKPLITNIMWRNITAQAIYHITILLILQFNGEAMFGANGKVKDTLIFNTFVLCQIFNKFNARVLEDKNIFKRIHQSKSFLGIIGGVIVLQAVMVEFLKRYGGTERLSWGQWGASIGIAAASWPIAWFVKWIPVPNKPFLSYLNEKKWT